jgi:hypothetical protein
MDKAAGKTCLAAAEIALQGNDIANLGECGNSRGQRRGGSFIGQIDDRH